MTHVMAPVTVVANLVGRSERTVRRWVAEGVLEACERYDGVMLVWAQQALLIEKERRTRNRARPQVKPLWEAGASEGDGL